MHTVTRTDGKQGKFAGVTFSGNPATGETDNPGKLAYFHRHPDTFKVDAGDVDPVPDEVADPVVPGPDAADAQLPAEVPGEVDPDAPPAQYDAAMSADQHEANPDETPVQDRPERRARRGNWRGN